MTPEQFVHWLKGFVAASHEFNLTPKAWESLKSELSNVDGIKSEEVKPVSVDSRFESIIEEAKRRYPVGTKFYPAHVDDPDGYCVVTEDTVFEMTDDYFLMAPVKGSYYTDPGREPQYGTTVYSRVIYDSIDDEWADIVEERKFITKSTHSNRSN